VILKVDTDKSLEVSSHFKINAIPLIKVYKDGKEVYDRTGYHTAEELEALLNKYI
jgi:thioredoxin-like negative regulator of GroEL